MKNIKPISLAALLITLLAFASCNSTAQTSDNTAVSDSQAAEPRIIITESGVFDMDKHADGLYAQMETNKGAILLSLEFEKAPLTVINFVGLAEGTKDHSGEEGAPFYDGLTFHRVIDDFMIQGGDPDGRGSGGPGYRFPDEFEASLVHDGPGILSMANAGPDSNGSQFFITHKETPWLDHKHAVFGRVVEGMDVVNAIAQGDTIEKLTIIRRGAAAEAFVADQAAFEAAVENNDARMADFAAQKEAREEELAKGMIPGAEVTESGIYWKILEEGNGASPSAGDTVSIHYTGALTSGQVFDSSKQRGTPFETAIGVGRLIKGWDEIVLLMKEGETRQIVIPPHLGYGAQGAGGVIPPNAWLFFEIELLEVK